MKDTMRNQLLYILLAFLCLPFQVFAMPNDSVRLVLEELDAIIDQKAAYHEQKEKELEAWKLKLRDSATKHERFDIYGKLFNEYLHYQADSSLFYIDERIQLLSSMERADLDMEVLINRAEVLGVMGMYTEALEQLKQVNPQTLDVKTLTDY